MNNDSNILDHPFIAEARKEIVDTLQSANISNQLQAALEQLARTVPPLCSSDFPNASYRLIARLKRIVQEATADSPEMRIWEVALDLMKKKVKDHPNGQAVLDGIAQLKPLLHDKLGDYQEVSLREITAETVGTVCVLSDTLTEPKASMVAPNAISLAQAHFNPHAWFRAVYADNAPVGFMMIEDNHEKEAYYLWRYMIAEPYHGRGFGAQAIKLLVDYVKTRPGAKELLVSCVPGEGSPHDFYVKQGFHPTGDIDHGEIVLKMTF